MSYTKEQELVLTNASPVNYDEAKVIGEAIGKSLPSVISKLQSMELVYIKKVVPAKKVAKETKAELVTKIEKATGADLAGLDKSTAKALTNLLEAVTPNEKGSPA